jgi:hypothetical protein
MSYYTQELRTINSRIDELVDFVDRNRVAPMDWPRSELGQTTTASTYPDVANAVYLINSGDFNVDDTEGAAATFVPDGGQFFAVNNGTMVPPEGTILTFDQVGGAWSFRYDG